MPCSDEIAACMAIAFEAVVNRDIPGKGVINSLLGFDPNDRAPAGHRRCPLDSVNADIGAAIDGNHAVAVDALACFDQLQREFDLHRIECRRFQQLVADTDAAIGAAHAVVETIDNHCAVIG